MTDDQLGGIDWDDDNGETAYSAEVQAAGYILSHTHNQRRYADLMRGFGG